MWENWILWKIIIAVGVDTESRVKHYRILIPVAKDLKAAILLRSCKDFKE